jgi:hypothetical protein
VEKNIEKAFEDISKYKERVNEIFDRRKTDHDDAVKYNIT